MWVGGVAGGVWKTTNGGASWSTTTDYLANLAVNCLAIDPANPDILYAGTGEGVFTFDSTQGDGIFKTTDGANWVQLANSRGFKWVNRLAISPTNSQIILAATQFGLYRSTDGGDSWPPTTLTAWGILDVDFEPATGTSEPGINCIAGTRGDGAYYSSNSGVTWTAATGLPTPAPNQVIPGRVELAYSRSNPSIVYASIEAFGGQLYRSTDGGHSYAYTGSAPTVTGDDETSFYNNASWEKDSPSASNFATGASWYNNALWIDPTNPNRLLVGGGELLSRSTQGGGGGWAGSTNIHADHHVIIEHPEFDGDFNRKLFAGNDGGIYWTNDAVATSPIVWTSLNHQLGIT